MNHSWTCIEPCTATGKTHIGWRLHLFLKHRGQKLCGGFTPLFEGFATCDKWEGHPGPHKALGIEWVRQSSCPICGARNGANYTHWLKAHRVEPPKRDPQFIETYEKEKFEGGFVAKVRDAWFMSWSLYVMSKADIYAKGLKTIPIILRIKCFLWYYKNNYE